jgi:uncharacterized protein YuzE
LRITYDAEVDVLRIILRDSRVTESDEVRAGFIIDHDESGGIVGIEILDASQHVTNPQSLEYAIAGSPRQNP